MNIVFRLDSSNLIGSGHVMRCLALANALRERKVKVRFICCDLIGNSIRIIKQNGFEVIELINKPNIQWEQDAKETISYLKQMEKPDWIFLDHYNLDIKWEKEIRPFVNQIAAIDDLANRQHDCDLLIDQNYYGKTICRYINLVPKFCTKFIGPRYALLRSEFKEARSLLKGRSGEVQQILVFLGGNDASNVTSFVLSTIEEIPLLNNKDLHVVVGGSNPNRDKIREKCEKKGYHYYCQINNIATLMAKSDFAIGAGGLSTWERCCMGLPSLVISLAHNQDVLVDNALSTNIFEYAGQVNNLHYTSFQKQLLELILDSEKLRKMSINGLNLVDGLGSDRIANYLLYGTTNNGNNSARCNN
ncbi:TPA: UDP-2,4-diacetamido-2,4,6-trideoxy-beta-L-altropyranose hydrolase [Legionella pneumophila]|nr:UDP-2,4-diacetamido-2,4,6-trideoxy-beta-L-altropyranose hydrolase [Legionella pneumophila]HAT2046647.1 UDP-2,4-diacetamido-2,4,6-trideoxy-beta-L-altropyranose hydrolase [Legionella pneumophila]HAT4006518.1 UDP-2,4-diacetamido-2,4,6-trideoxy-beta-L-altropyranose hydrolase [Legionella pneumophila]HAT6361444.1 UDP-2,4-diacetamido-2,4,6-trideoxy-beta-L-altropyranose hydrolase [Legionella pneumophila]HAT6368537.1 UDP-2,4-diacetamido-2,4,6-trideoxy-beta-L-altropyranose hydrolase [Legionella pneumo